VPDAPSCQWQAVTVENRILKLRWMAEGPPNGSKQLADIIA
jgi:hypothetical protein